MSDRSSWRLLLGAAVLLAGGCAVALPNEPAATAARPAGAASAPLNSALDAPLFYQLLIGEIELNEGEAGAAFEVILDAARRTGDDALFRRAVDIALRGRAGDRALAATKAWRTSNPSSLDALRLQLQILSALNRLNEAAEPLRTLLTLTPEAARANLITAMPRFLQRGSDKKKVAQVLEEVLKPYAEEPFTRVAAKVSMGRGWHAAGDGAKALALARDAQRDDAKASGPVLLAMELMPTQPQAEQLVAAWLQQPDAAPEVRMAYVRTLTNMQRYPEAVAQLQTVTQQRPELAPPYLSLGALLLEVGRAKQGEAALLHYVELAQAQHKGDPAAAAAAASAGASSAAADDDDADDPAHAQIDKGLIQAWLMLSQAAEQRGDFKAAESWLAKVDDPQRALEVQTRRASILARQGHVEQARALIRQVPERSPEDARAKLLAEAGVLRDIKDWKGALEVLSTASQKSPDDADLLYEQAMMDEKLGQFDAMERLLRRVIELKPDNAQASNALGYSLADRRVRLPEAHKLIQRALELAPGDPFITDSLGWVEYRMGNREESLRLLRQAYAARPDPEIAAHLGEVLWAFGEQDEARKVWTEAKGKDAGNDVLQETLSRLKVGL